MIRASNMIVVAVLCWTTAAWAGDAWQKVTTEQGLPGNEVQFVKRDGQGTTWIGTSQGLARWVEGKPEKTPVRGETWDVLRMTATRYWVGTGGGAALVDGEKVTATLAGHTVAPILPFGDKAVAALGKDRRTEKSTLYFNTGGEKWEAASALKGKHVVDLMRAADGRLWACVEGDGVAIFDPGKAEAPPSRDLQAQSVTTIMQDSTGKVWCGLWQRGLAVHDGKGWTPHLKAESVYPLAIREDKAGRIWVATDKSGLWRYDGKGWTQDVKDEGPISLLETTADGRVWISSQSAGGLRYWNGKTWTTSLEGPTPMRCLYEAPDGTLIAGSVLEGLFVLKGSGKAGK